MTEARFVRWVVKPLAWVACLGPAGWLVRGIVTGDLGADPIKTLTHTTGLSALIILLVTLGITPVRRITGWNALVRVRRLVGLFAFFYALIHLSIYAVFDHELSVPAIAADIVEHPWVLVGFTAFLILLVLAITSPVAAVRRLGGKRWRLIHRGAYLAAMLGVLHFYWLVKKDTREPLTYGAVLLILLAARFPGRPGPPGRVRPSGVAETSAP